MTPEAFTKLEDHSATLTALKNGPGSDRGQYGIGVLDCGQSRTMRTRTPAF